MMGGLQHGVRWRYWVGILAATMVLNGGAIWASAPTSDPFRKGNEARPFAPEVTAAFESFFCTGDYSHSRELLQQAEKAAPGEPMVYAMLASIAYIEEDFDAIERYTDRTRQAALALKPSDPLRGHLYEGVSYGFDAALGIARNGVALGLPRALPNLNKLYASIRSANAVDPDDPELNLLNGYMDLLLTRRERAVEQLSKASPTYVSYRGMALAYRDLDRDREALEAVEKAMAGQCDNPELYYLKAQILRILERNSESVDFYNRALAAADQLPPAVVRDIKKERDRTQQRLTSSKPVAGI